MAANKLYGIKALVMSEAALHWQIIMDRQFYVNPLNRIEAFWNAYMQLYAQLAYSSNHFEQRAAQRVIYVHRMNFERVQ